MKSCWILSDRPSAKLEFRDVIIPSPGAGEVVIRVVASSVNRGELLGSGPPKIGGGDAAGVVDAVGANVPDLRRGDRVFGRVVGGWAEYALARADQLMSLGERLSWEEAAAVGVAYLAAYELVFPPYGRLQKGETLLLAGASSGVGVAALQLGKALGATVIGTSGSINKLMRLEALGLDHGIATRSPDFSAEVKELTGGAGADLAINLIGGSVFAELMRSMSRKGRLGIAGYVDGMLVAEINLALLHANRLEIFGISNARMTTAERAAVMQGFRRDVLPLLDAGAIVPAVDQVFPFARMEDAKAHMQANAHVGKVVIRMGG